MHIAAGESSGRVSAIELDKGSEFPPQTFMDTKTNTGTGSGCQLSTSLLFKEGEAIVRALDANFIPNDSGINRAGTAPDASGQYRIFDYNNFSKIDSTTRTNFVRACMDIVAPVCRQPSTVDLSSQGDNEQQAKDEGKNMGLLIAIVSVLVLGLGGLVYGRVRGKVATRSVMGYIVLCGVASFFYYGSM